jgi:polysaccharide export outer membrane protein
MAGGPTERGAIKGTCIIRGTDQKNSQRIKVNIDKLIKSGDLSQNVMLQPGDVVYVPETSKPDWSKISSIVGAIVNSSYLLRIW